MSALLEQTIRSLRKNPRLKGLDVELVEDELHLSHGDDKFARLIPLKGAEGWRMELFRNLEDWECLDFTGTLDECLDFLSDQTHYIFWE